MSKIIEEKMIYLELEQEPVSWAPARMGKSCAYNPKGKEKRETIEKIKWLMPALFSPIKGFVGLNLEFLFSIPSSTSKKKRQKMLDGEIFPTSKDCTNMQKFIEDCLKNIAFEDDRYVFRVTSSKRYAEKSKILINVYSLDEYNNGEAV